MPSSRENGNTRRIMHSREFLLSVGGSEACKKLPAGIDPSVLRGSHAAGLWTSEAAWAYFRAERWDDQWGGSHGCEWDSPKHAQEPETVAGSKSKICFRFFSTVGCRFGDACNFLHYFPGGHHQAVAEMANMGDAALPGGLPMEPAVLEGPPKPTVKTGLCKTAQRCKWGANTHVYHTMPPTMVPRPIPNPSMATQASFGASASAKVSVDASLAGAIIGRGGVNTRKIFQLTGARVVIRDHESDTSLNNIELQGTFDQIMDASTLVSELIASIGGSAPPQTNNTARGAGSHFKTKLCVYFTQGFCTHGDRCLFAHGENELRK